jgi:chromate reductase, NAD(P)H dehydrogenase (quinone)
MVKQIGYVVGSLRKESLNRRLAAALVKLGPPDFSFKELKIGDLPLYNQDDDKAQAPEVQRLKSELRGCDAVIFVTPEYNRSIPGVLKNAIDHASRPYGQSAWSGKPAGIIGASPGQIGTAVAQGHLRTCLGFLDMPTLGQPEAYIQIKDGFFDDAGNVANPESKKFLSGWMDKYVAWVKRITAAS